MIPAPVGYIGLGLASNGFFQLGNYRVQVGSVVVKITQNMTRITIRDIFSGAAYYSNKLATDFWNVDARRNNAIPSMSQFMIKVNAINPV